MSDQLFHQIGSVTRVIFARMRFLLVFVVAALLVGYWDSIKNHWDKWTRPAAAATTEESDEYWTCAMHPQIHRAEPGNCPLCGMTLFKQKKGKPATLPEGDVARVQLTPQRVALASIGTSPVGRRELVREIHTVGVLDYNETKVAQLSARVAGRADELFIQYTGQAVKAGDPVYSLYSPDVYTAQREYLLARKRVNDLPADASADAKKDASDVYNASMQKLILWGISPQQLDAMDKEYDQTGKVPTHLVVTSPISGIVVRKNLFEGGYVQAGDTPYTIADLSTLWLKAKIYERDVPLVRIGQGVTVTVDALPNQGFPGVVAFRAFQLDPQTRTLDARIEVKNPGLQLQPNMFADAAMRVPIGLAGAAVSQPATLPATAPALAPSAEAQVFQAALAPYLEAHKLLGTDKAEGVSALLHAVVQKLEPISRDAAIQPAYQRLFAAVQKTGGQDLAAVRKTFKEISVAMIEIGKEAGLPAGTPAVQVFRCPMTDKPYWLQVGAETLNPYYGSEMPTCGAAVEALPKVDPMRTPATRPAAPAERMPAVPRSAVIDTGGRKIVFVQFAEGVFHMREVTVGPLAFDAGAGESGGEFYPVLKGLDEGDKVVTAGAFLLDAENRLSPTTQP